MSNNYIGISEDRLHHILGVARECYSIAKSLGKDEEFCRKMFTIGWNHDIGYEFAVEPSNHADISHDMLKLIGVCDKDKEGSLYAVKNHGKCNCDKTLEFIILNTADMTVDSKGNKVSVEERLTDIQLRYGSNSVQYLTAFNLATKLGLLTQVE